MKARRKAVTASVAIVALAAMGLCVPFSGCKGDKAADDQSRGAAATGTDEDASARPAAQSGTASAEPLAEALRGVIKEMLEETGADLSPEQVTAETEARYREGVEAVQRFYPEFLEETMPTGPETAEERIAAVIRVFGQVLAASPFHDVPIEAWLLQKHNAGQLDPVRTELLAQCSTCSWGKARLLAGRGDRGWRKSGTEPATRSWR